MEALILYFILFYPGIMNVPAPGPISGIGTFSTIRELSRTITYAVPAFALLWYLMSDKKGFSALEAEKPGKKDLLPFIIGLTGLIIISIGISLLIMFFPEPQGLPPPPKISAPHNPIGWIVIVLSCISTGYLEESYFRYYLLSKFDDLIPQGALRIVLSTVLFAVCHIYEGPWGVMNAALAGMILGIVFIKYRSLHGVAIAHGVYNIFVYVIG